MSELIIRQGRPDDRERVLEILLDGFRGRTVHHWMEERFGQIGGQPWEEWKRAEVVSFLDAHADWLVVAERDGRVVGFATYALNRARGVGEIRNNAVDPACQGQGIGPALYRRLLEIFRAEGMRFAWVGTGLEPEYAQARRAYEKVGFQPFHEAVYYVQEL